LAIDGLHQEALDDQHGCYALEETIATEVDHISNSAGGAPALEVVVHKPRVAP
jgi:hypothetical protein